MDFDISEQNYIEAGKRFLVGINPDAITKFYRGEKLRYNRRKSLSAEIRPLLNAAN